MPNRDPKFQKANRERLQAMLEGGRLKIITNMHACGAGIHPDFDGFDPKKCAAYEHTLFSPLHFVIHDVVELEDLPSGKVRALGEPYTAPDGRKTRDWTQGLPSVLVRRLDEATVALEEEERKGAKA